MSKSFAFAYLCKNFKKNICLTLGEYHGVKQSKKNYVAEQMWPEVNQRVNYSINRVLVTLQKHEFFNFDDPVMKFCVS